MAENGILTRRADILAAAMAGRTILALGLTLALAACATTSARMSEDVTKAGAFVATAVVDTEKVAQRGRAYHSVNDRIRAAHQVEEAEVILRKAHDAREGIRKALQAAVAELAELRAKTLADELDATGDETNFIPDHISAMVAADRVDRIRTILATSDRHVATIKKSVAALQGLDIPGLR